VTVSQPAEDATLGVALAGLIASRLDRFLWFAKPSSMTLLSQCSLAAVPRLSAAQSRLRCAGIGTIHRHPHSPHYVASSPAGETVTLRVLFATDPANEQRVRSLIGEALATGQLTGPDGRVATWHLRSVSPGRIRPDEEDHAAHLRRRQRRQSLRRSRVALG
jgi:hypothetical protein